MAENKPKKKQSSPLVGSQAQPTTLDNTTTLDIDTNKVSKGLTIKHTVNEPIITIKDENISSGV